MKIKCSNFGGDWDSLCPYCNEPQRNHQYYLGDFDGIRHISRMPCEKEKHQIRKKAAMDGIIRRTIILVYNFIQYIWGLIPFKEEAKLIWQFIKHIFVSLKSLLFLHRNKPK